MKLIRLTIVLILLSLLIGCSDENASPSVSTNTTLTVLNITYEGDIPIDNKIDITLMESMADNQTEHLGRIERRGGLSISYPKHSYEIDLQEDNSIVGLPEDDDWILNASYIDKTFIRHVFAYDLFRSMHPKNIASNTNYVEVELNGNYNGLYVLMEKLDKSSLDIEDKDPGALIFKEPHIFRESYDATPQDPNNFHQQIFPKIEDLDRRDYLENIRDFILNSSKEVFESEFRNIFSLQSIIDWHLLLLLTNNNDGILKNFYLYKKDTSSPIRIAPWDYDHSLGRDGDNELNLDERQANLERSILFRRLLKYDWYKSALKESWTDLNEAEILSLKSLKASINTRSVEVADAAIKNFELWPTDNSIYYDDNGFEEEVDIILEFLDLRHTRLTTYFDQL